MPVVCAIESGILSGQIAINAMVPCVDCAAMFAMAVGLLLVDLARPVTVASGFNLATAIVMTTDATIVKWISSADDVVVTDFAQFALARIWGYAETVTIMITRH